MNRFPVFDDLSTRPGIERLRTFVERLFETRGDDIVFVVLFGSMARGDFGPRSDFDVLVALSRDSSPRWRDRLGDLLSLSPGGIDVFPYTLAELREMEASAHLTLLEAMDHGLPLRDDGTFALMRSRHEDRKRRGLLERLPGAWRRKVDRFEDVPAVPVTAALGEEAHPANR